MPRSTPATTRPDRIDRIDRIALDRNTDALADTLATYALSTAGLKP